MTETRGQFIERFASRYPEAERPMVRSLIRTAALVVLGEDDGGPMYFEQHLQVIAGLHKACEASRAEAVGAGR